MVRALVAAMVLVVLIPPPITPTTTHLSFPFVQSMDLDDVIAPPVTWSDPQIAPPQAGLVIEAWFDCRPPHHDAVCVDGFDEAEQIAAVLRAGPTTADGWRPIVEQYFQPRHVSRALRVMRCESGGDPSAKNPTSTASGLFQHLGSLWPARAERAGWGHADVFDPHANIAVAAWLVYEGGGWGHWNPSRHCWG